MIVFDASAILITATALCASLDARTLKLPPPVGAATRLLVWRGLRDGIAMLAPGVTVGALAQCCAQVPVADA